MGEKYVANILTNEGVRIEQAINHYDSQKDLVGDGYDIEVKTQVPFIRERAFSIRPNQLNKCRNVDVLYFISVPASLHKFDLEGWLFRIDPKNFVTKTKMTRDGREMTLIPIDQESVVPVHKIDDYIMKEMIKYTVTVY